jgi:hypothetical protein
MRIGNLSQRFDVVLLVRDRCADLRIQVLSDLSLVRVRAKRTLLKPVIAQAV